MFISPLPFISFYLEEVRAVVPKREENLSLSVPSPGVASVFGLTGRDTQDGQTRAGQTRDVSPVCPEYGEASHS